MPSRKSCGPAKGDRCDTGTSAEDRLCEFLGVDDFQDVSLNKGVSRLVCSVQAAARSHCGQVQRGSVLQGMVDTHASIELRASALPSWRVMFSKAHEWTAL